MRRNKQTPLLLGLALFFTFVSCIGATENLQTTDNFNVEFSNDIGFSHYNLMYVLLSTNGLNGSSATIRMNNGGGTFAFTANNTASITVTYTVTTCKVKEADNPLQVVSSGYTFQTTGGLRYIFQWNVISSPALPVNFILGMVGLACMSGGSLYSVQQFKEKEYYQGVRNGAIFISIGVGFFLAWLW